eukprot:g6355.t1
MELLSKIPGVEVWKVQDSVEELLAIDEWIITSEGTSVISRIGAISWQLSSSLNCLKAQERSFVFAIQPHSSLFYCVNVPITVSKDDVLVLETVLDSFTAYEIKEAVYKVDRTEKFINGLNRATSSVVYGMSATAQFVGEKLKQGAEKYKEQRPPCAEPKQVSEQTKNRIQRVRNVARTVSGIASGAVEAVSIFTSRAADAIVGNHEPSDPSKPTTKAKRVAAAVVVSAAEIYEGMIDAFLTVSKRTAEATTEMMTHSYGPEVGQISKDTLSAAGHSANAVISSTRLGTKAILRSTVKKTAVGYMSNQGTAGSS